MSAIDVINGALAVAGSIFNFVNIKGNESPMRLPVITVNTIVRLTTQIISGERNSAINITPLYCYSQQQRHY